MCQQLWATPSNSLFILSSWCACMRQTVLPLPHTPWQEGWRSDVVRKEGHFVALSHLILAHHRLVLQKMWKASLSSSGEGIWNELPMWNYLSLRILTAREACCTSPTSISQPLHINSREPEIRDQAIAFLPHHTEQEGAKASGFHFLNPPGFSEDLWFCVHSIWKNVRFSASVPHLFLSINKLLQRNNQTMPYHEWLSALQTACWKQKNYY